MATIKDGVRIGIGLLLFKWMLGFGGCAIFVGAMVCVAANEKQSSNTSKSTSTSTYERLPPRSSNVSNIVRFKNGCNLRDNPEKAGQKVGFATAGVEYNVLERRGGWRRIALENGKEGWAGCSPDQ